MQTTQPLSEDSPLEDGEQAAMPVPVSLEFTEVIRPEYDVEYADVGNDIVYHYWPNRGKRDFPDGFAKILEDAYKSLLPEDADVRAAYTDREEAAVLMRFNEPEGTEADPVPTYFVKVIGWANNPMSDKFLKDRLFIVLDRLLSERNGV